MPTGQEDFSLYAECQGECSGIPVTIAVTSSGDIVIVWGP